VTLYSLIFSSVIVSWSMLIILGGERQRQVDSLKLRKHRAAEAAQLAADQARFQADLAARNRKSTPAAVVAPVSQQPAR